MLTQKPTETNKYNNTLDFETVLNHSFANYKKIALYAGSALLVFLFFYAIFLSAVSISIVGAENISKKSIENFQKLLLTKPYVWYYTGFSILTSCLLSPFMASFYKMADAAEKDTSFGVSGLFSMYTSPLFVPIFSVTFLIGLATNGLSLVFDEIGLSFVGILLILIISFFTILTIPLIVLGNYSTIESIKTSIAIVTKQPIVILMLVIIAILGVCLGLFAFCIGAFFTYPFLISVVYTIYNQATSKEKLE
ncbi:hypothetical protein [Flavobacterium polysaccharolyticum]|uniref:Beta-carotene 15,15'-monooxygenase n=1 Tax=Flavobacterium polysaccharolyticum TaxID=3133148 RepID=A0ABU9NMK6_9FLAO